MTRLKLVQMAAALFAVLSLSAAGEHISGRPSAAIRLISGHTEGAGGALPVMLPPGNASLSLMQTPASTPALTPTQGLLDQDSGFRLTLRQWLGLVLILLIGAVASLAVLVATVWDFFKHVLEDLQDSPPVNEGASAPCGFPGGARPRTGRGPEQGENYAFPNGVGGIHHQRNRGGHRRRRQPRSGRPHRAGHAGV